MKKLYTIVIMLALIPTIVLAVGAPAPEILSQNEGLFQWVLGLALLGNGLFITRLLKSHDRLWERGDNQETRLSHLEGARKNYEEG